MNAFEKIAENVVEQKLLYDRFATFHMRDAFMECRKLKWLQ